MQPFQYRGRELFAEDVSLLNLARRYGTPLYVYSHQALRSRYQALKKAFASARPLICYSMKANSSLGFIRALVRQGAGVDIVSGGELKKALRAGVPASKIVYASVGKTPQEIRAALRAKIYSFNVESIGELEQIHQVAKSLRLRQRVALRLNPEVDPHTHHFISTGRKQDKFGMHAKQVLRILSDAKRYPHLAITGLHIHIGSQITTAGPFQTAIRKALRVIEQARRKGARIDALNIGGGFGIVYRDEKPKSAARLAKAILPLLRRKNLKLILEPGRFIAGNSGVLLTQVLYIKQKPSKRFAIVDAGMNDLVRPSLYDAHHEILPVVPRPNQTKSTHRYDIVGPVCESGDFLAKARSMPPLSPGDLLSVMSAGAYGFVMASNYNSRTRPAEILVNKSQVYLIRRRERQEDLTRGEIIPSFLK